MRDTFDLILGAQVVRGHGVASGANPDGAYVGGTLAPQLPLFAERGLDLSRFHRGTINLATPGHVLRLIAADHTFSQVAWTDRIPPEDFSFSRAQVAYQGQTYAAYVYWPHPETKVEHFQEPGLIEVIAEEVPALTYGANVELRLQREHFGDFWEDDPFRPHFHLTPWQGWINDPNGLVHDGSRWHAFYQYYNPDEVDGM